VLLVKLADRLHNMRTLSYIASAEKRQRIARETMEIYAPLAERIGMQQMKDELEDYSFIELYPDAYASISARLKFLKDQAQDDKLIDRIVDEMKTTLADGGIVAEVSGREKRPYSIWRKMKRKNVEFEQLSDIFAFRVVVDSVEDCYRALGIIHTAYACVPEQFDDYISTPKPNGYRSLHTAVFGPERRRIEVQIRTAEMHELAELGVAAHWRYKQGGRDTDGRRYRWIRELLDILETASGPAEFLENTKLEMFADQVFCFTPKGELIALPGGATPIDFAYAVHSEVGDRCVGVKINGRMAPLRTILHNGDQVEILTSETGSPSPTWEQSVVSGKARAQIRRFVRIKQRDEFIRLGKAMLEKAFREAGFDMSPDALSGIIDKFNAKSVDDLYVEVGNGQVTGNEVIRALAPHAILPEGDGDSAGSNGTINGANGEGAMPIPIRGLIPGMAVHYGNCCHPLPGDRIVGIVTPGKGVAVHTIDCETLESFQSSPERWLDIAWDLGPTSRQAHVGRLHMIVANQRGTLGTMSTIIAQNLGNIHNLKFTNRSADFYEMLVDIEVADIKHLTNIIAALRAAPEVSSVERMKS
jgi:GTP pyrophosphokinase